MIEIKHASLCYGTKADAEHVVLGDVNLTVPTGQVCAIIGPSGCGKSTLLKVVAGLLKPDFGHVWIDGQETNPKAMKIGFMPQNYGLLPWQTVEQNILLGERIRGKKNAYSQEELRALMRELGIAGLEKRYPRELSGGQQQRVALARSFLLEPDILLMDEPFSALDAITREEMQDVFLDLWQSNQITTMLVTHYVEEALYLGQQIAVMAPHGRIADIIDNPLSGSREKRDSEEFFAMGKSLREKIRQLEVSA